MGADLNNIVKTQRLSDDHVQFLVYQILRGLKVHRPHRHRQTDRDTDSERERETDGLLQ